MTSPGAFAGVLAPVGKAHTRDYKAFSEAGLSLIRLRAQVNPLEDLAYWHDAGAVESILQLLSPLPGKQSVSIPSYVDEFSPVIESYLDLGGHYIEVHDEPNRRARGTGVSWQDGVAFSAWFSGITERLRSRFGNTLRIGFPALALTTMPRPEAAAPVDDAKFLNACRDSLAAADWAALHIYWCTREDMRSYEGALAVLRQYLERFPDQNFAITEFANVTATLDPAERGRQYCEFITLTAQYHQMFGVCGFPLSSNDPHIAALSWVLADHDASPVIKALGARQRMPDPERLWFSWPTDTQGYVRYFGENQREYYADYGLAGGHNGVDLCVNPQSPATSAIYAAYPGTVQQVALDDTGYTWHVRISGYGPDQQALEMLYAHLSAIDVKPGMLVKRGDVLGWGSVSRRHTGDEGAHPYVHFGLRIAGIELTSTGNWVNPQPYLDAIPRGVPAHAYARTYVLLPASADASWAASVVRACWGNERYVLGANPDDAGIGDLAMRQVIAVNPDQWRSDLAAFFKLHYPGVSYIPLTVDTPPGFERRLAMFPPQESPIDLPMWVQGQPRRQYPRTYVLLPPAMPVTQAAALIEATWDESRYTVGTLVDDAAIGDLDNRKIIAVLPEAWKQDLQAYYRDYYPGVIYQTVQAGTFSELIQNLKLALKSG